MAEVERVMGLHGQGVSTTIIALRMSTTTVAVLRILREFCKAHDHNKKGRAAHGNYRSDRWTGLPSNRGNGQKAGQSWVDREKW